MALLLQLSEIVVTSQDRAPEQYVHTLLLFLFLFLLSLLSPPSCFTSLLASFLSVSPPFPLPFFHSFWSFLPFFPLSHPCLLASFITTRTQVLLFSPESTSRCSTSSDTKDQLLTYGVRSLPVTQLFRGLIWRLWYAISFAYLLRIPRPYSFLASEIWGQTICLLSLSLSSHYSDVSPGKTNSSFPLLLLSDFWSKAMNVWVR